MDTFASYQPRRLPESDEISIDDMRAWLVRTLFLAMISPYRSKRLRNLNIFRNNIHVRRHFFAALKWLFW